MKRALHTLVLVLVALVSVAPAQEGVTRSPRERWEAMTPEQRAQIKERFEAFQGMQEGRRRELRERHGRLKDAERRAVDRLPREARKQLDALPAAKRRELVHELAEEELAERGRELRKHLPAEVREQLGAAAPEQRRAILEEFKRRHRREGMRGLLDRAERELRLGPAERRTIEALPEPERADRLLDLYAQSMRDRFARDGWPEWVDAEDRTRLESLESRSFLEQLHARRRTAGEAAKRGRRGPPGTRDTPTDRPGAEDEPRSGLPPGFGRPDPAWRVELASMTPEERHAEIEARVRRRVDTFLDEHPDALTAEQRAKLDAARGRDYFEALRELGLGARGGSRDRARDGEGERGPRDRPEGREGPGGRDRPGGKGERGPGGKAGGPPGRSGGGKGGGRKGRG